jgi:hypothetical protein
VVQTAKFALEVGDAPDQEEPEQAAPPNFFFEILGNLANALVGFLGKYGIIIIIAVLVIFGIVILVRRR